MLTNNALLTKIKKITKISVWEKLIKSFRQSTHEEKYWPEY